MVLVDANVLVYAHRGECARHAEFRGWLENLINGAEAFGIAPDLLASFVRIVTHPRIFSPPTPLDSALAFCAAVLRSDSCVVVRPGARHWQIFTDLCRSADVKGNLVADAYLAALAVESGSDLVTTDRDLSRFPGLRWHPPLR